MAKEDTQFKKGQSGNPAGRKKALTTAQQLRDYLEPDMRGIIDILKRQAKQGDQGAIKLLMDRCYPSLKPQALPVTVPVGKDMVESGNNVIAETFNGQLSPDVAAMMLAGLANLAKLQEVGGMAQRLAAIEGLLKSMQQPVGKEGDYD